MRLLVALCACTAWGAPAEAQVLSSLAHLQAAATGAKKNAAASRNLRKPAQAAGSPARRSLPAPAPGTPAVRRPSSPELSGLGVEALLAEAKQLYDALEYDQVVPYAEEVLRRPGVPIEKQLEVQLLKGSCLAVVGNPVDAEKPFRLVLRGRPDFDMAPDTPPKILAVFRKVQVEERAIRQQLRELELRRVVQSLSLTGDHPQQGLGGEPVPFRYRLRDPRGVVASTHVLYRRQGEKGFSSLALRQDEQGFWSGQLPGEWTANDSGLVIEYYLRTADAGGNALLEVASLANPLLAVVAAGEVRERRPITRSPWFWSAVGTAVAAAATASFFWHAQATRVPEGDLKTLAVE